MPTPLEIRIDELESQLFELEQNEDSVEVYNGKDIDLSDVAAADTAEYPWQIFDDDGVWSVRYGLFRYAGVKTAVKTPTGVITEFAPFAIPIIGAAAGTEYIPVYIITDFSELANPIALITSAQSALTKKEAPDPDYPDRYDHFPIGWLEVDTAGEVVDHGQWMTGGVINYTRGDA